MRYAILTMLVLLLVLTSCGKGDGSKGLNTKFNDLIDHSKPIAFGEDDEIYVFCGQQNWAKLEDVIRASLEREVGLVYNEKYFFITHADIKEIDRLSKYKNLLFIGSVEAGDPVSNHIRESLSPELTARVQSSGGDLFVTKNRFSRDQLIMHLVAKDDARLMDLANIQSSRIFGAMLDRYSKRLAYHAYQTKLIPAEFFEPYPFTLSIPENYSLYSNDTKNNFLSFIYRARMQNREIPDKYISVHWEEMETDMVDEAWMLQKRVTIGERHFDGDVLDPAKLRTEKFSFAGFEGLRLTGPWENPKHMVGGAFQSYAFWHPQSKKAFFVDNSVYFPAGDKLSILVELFMISSSLKIK
ncbi:MAG: DUF4837 family protein [Candidatus Cloacimonadaceae bacterium]|nr:DUF4837 family protein [Candidatus Cloacimonadaceae bacterium]